MNQGSPRKDPELTPEEIKVPAFLQRAGSKPADDGDISTEATARALQKLEAQHHALKRQYESDKTWRDYALKTNNELEKTYELEKQRGRERIRMIITSSILASYLLSNIILACLVVCGVTSIGNAKDISAVFLAPILGLAGSALGFYFGISVYEDVKSSIHPKMANSDLQKKS